MLVIVRFYNENQYLESQIETLVFKYYNVDYLHVHVQRNLPFEHGVSSTITRLAALLV